MDKTALTQKDLTESLLKLCAPKTPVLKKETKVPKFTPNEKLTINKAFANNLVVVPLIPQTNPIKIVENQKDMGNQLDAEVIKERSQVIEAVCVRIMKARKTEGHNPLIDAIIRQIKMFQADPRMIKKRIESLIERDYLERDTNTRGRYIYKP